MPLEHLEKLFTEVGEAAEKLAALKAQAPGQVIIGGPVAKSESVQSVADIHAQTGGKPAGVSITEATAHAEALARMTGDRVADAVRKAVSEAVARVAKREKSRSPEKQEKSPWSLKNLPPMSWVQAGLKLADYVEKQDRAGKAVDGFTRALAIASRMLYSMASGNIFTKSGRPIPWRRAMAGALRGRPGARFVRRALLFPDVVIRRVRRNLAEAHRADRPVVRAAKTALHHAIKPRTVGRTITEAAVKPAARAAVETAVKPGARAAVETAVKPAARAAVEAAVKPGTRAAVEAAVKPGARAAVQTAAPAATAGATAGAGATNAAGTAAATIGRGALALAGPVGVAAAVIMTLVSAIVMAVTGLRKFTYSVYESSKALVHSRFEKYAQFSPAMGAAEARLEAYDIGSRMRYARATSATTVQLTEALIQLRREMGPINRAMINMQNIMATMLIHVARGLNVLLRIGLITPLVEWVLKKLAGETPEREMPAEAFLRSLENIANPRGRNLPPQGGLPPWQ